MKEQTVLIEMNRDDAEYLYKFLIDLSDRKYTELYYENDVLATIPKWLQEKMGVSWDLWYIQHDMSPLIDALEKMV